MPELKAEHLRDVQNFIDRWAPGLIQALDQVKLPDFTYQMTEVQLNIVAPVVRFTAKAGTKQVSLSVFSYRHPYKEFIGVVPVHGRAYFTEGPNRVPQAIALMTNFFEKEPERPAPSTPRKPRPSKQP